MSSGAIYWSGIGAVVYACSAERLGKIAGKGLEIRSREVFATGVRQVTVVGPVLEDEAIAVHTGYWNAK